MNVICGLTRISFIVSGIIWLIPNRFCTTNLIGGTIVSVSDHPIYSYNHFRYQLSTWVLDKVLDKSIQSEKAWFAHPYLVVAVHLTHPNFVFFSHLCVYAYRFSLWIMRSVYKCFCLCSLQTFAVHVITCYLIVLFWRAAFRVLWQYRYVCLTIIRT